jgi:hypothetical protein
MRGRCCGCRADEYRVRSRKPVVVTATPHHVGRVTGHGSRLAGQTNEYADLTDEQKRIVDADDEIAGQFPEGLTKEQLFRLDARAVRALIPESFARARPSDQVVVPLVDTRDIAGVSADTTMSRLSPVPS